MEQSSFPPDPAAAMMNGALTLGLTVSPHVAARLVLYMKELLHWNARINLTSLKTETEIISKHFLDSLAGFKVFDPRPGLKILDVGTGAGFPGMVLQLQAPVLSVTLLEPSTKKSAFLHHIAGLLGVLNTRVETTRIEDFTDHGGYDLITSRALKTELLLTAAPRLLRAGGGILLYRASTLPTAPHGYDIARQVSFELPWTNEPRTMTLLKLEGDVGPRSLPIIGSC